MTSTTYVDSSYIAISVIASYYADSTDYVRGIEWNYNKLYATQGSLVICGNNQL